MINYKTGLRFYLDFWFGCDFGRVWGFGSAVYILGLIKKKGGQAYVRIRGGCLNFGHRCLYGI